MVGKKTAQPFLSGMKQITGLVGFSEASVLKHKRQYPGMPINLVSGRWIGEPELLIQFYKDLAAGNTAPYLAEPTPPDQG